MRRLTLALAALSCASHSAAAPAPREVPATMPTASLSSELVGWIVLGDLRALDDGGALKSELVSAIAAPELALAMDPKRPLAIALLDWKKHPEMPLALALPLQPGAKIADGQTITAPHGPPLRVHVAGGVAYVGWEPAIADAAPALLAPILARPVTAAIVARVLVPNLSRLAGDDIEKAIGRFMTLSSPEASSDPRAAFGLRALRGVAPFLRAASAIEIRADATSAGVAVSVDMEGPEHGEWADYVARRHAGAAWGLNLLPADAILAFSSRLDPKTDVDALATFFAGDQDAAALRPAIAAFAATLPGELAYATWPATGGGMGVGGAFAATKDTRARLLDAYRALGDDIGPTVAHELGVNPGKLAFTVSPPAADRIDGTAVDRIDLVPQQKSGDIGKVLDWMYGGDGVQLGIAFVGGTCVWAAGRDWRPRLGAMIAETHGRRGPSARELPGLAGLDPRGLVSTSWVSPAGLATFVTRTLEATGEVDADEREVLAPFLAPGAAHAAIVTTTRIVHRPGVAIYRARSVIPPAVIGDLGHIGGAFWRVGLSLLTGPPPAIPLPVPPPQVTPPPRVATPPDEHQGPQPGLPPAHST